MYMYMYLNIMHTCIPDARVMVHEYRVAPN